MEKQWELLLRKQKNFFYKKDIVEIIKQQSKLLFNEIDKSDTNYDCYAFKQNEVVMETPVYIGLAALELSNVLTYET